jgi:cytochrome P450
MMNNNESIFPDPQAFRPERWLEARARGENLHKHLGTFGKGSRMCLGMKYVI